MDWLSVTKEELVRSGMRQSLKKTDLGNMLEQLHPHIEWTRFHQWKGRLSQQKQFERVVSAIFEVADSVLLVSQHIQKHIQRHSLH
jgi:hypothetical protein